MKLAKYCWLWMLTIASCGLVSGCKGQFSESGTTAEDVFPELPRLSGTATIQLVVNTRNIIVEVNGEDAPITSGNFVDLVQQGVYDGVAFHRVVRDPEPFVVQGGDPQSKTIDGPDPRLGTGNFLDPVTGSPRYIPLEITPSGDDEPIYGNTFPELEITTGPELPHLRGAIAMARSAAPNSASAQFYFALTDLSFLDGQYAVFGYVTEGMDVVDAIQQGDRIESATVISGLENLQQP
ncbi:MAG: peptidylprolyl isomerase [Merismopedia sp. SIO2A8]|nr:peptidylprolyl isomerase [Merismopedia sp. SIO2A8]